MDGQADRPAESGKRAELVRTARALADAPDALASLAAGLGEGPFALVALFAAPQADFAGLMSGAAAAFSGAEVIGCTTAGEISDRGYCEGSIVAMAFPRALFHVETLVLRDLSAMVGQDLIGQTIRGRARLTATAPGMQHEFAFLLVDGLSLREDELAAALASGLGPVPLFGGSAGDGTRFRRTLVGAGGAALENAAVLTFVRSHCPVRVFSLNHFRPTGLRMVVTGADPGRRIVHSINAEPAGRELARIMGKDPDQIDTFTFASTPVVVRFGGDHHVRAIKRVTAEGALEFFSAIDEGMVLTLAQADDMVGHLSGRLDELAQQKTPAAILACDCLLRRIEAEQKQLTQPVSEVLAAHRVTGFCTYGEQFNSMHVNQTMTGVAIYPPGAALP